jgi:signal transduction histidine kinase
MEEIISSLKTTNRNIRNNKNITSQKNKCLLLLNSISNIRDHYLIKKNKFRIQISTFMLDIFLHNISDMFSSEIKQRNLKFEIINDVPPDKMKLCTDGFKLAQITMNLIENSLQFTKSGHILLHAQIEKKMVG